MEIATKEKIKKVAGICGNVLIWTIVVVSLLVTILVFSAQGSDDGVPALFGTSLVTIESGSMEPTYNSGDLVFMTKIDDAAKAALKKGDIITYHAPIDINGDGVLGDINTHRIVEVDTVAKTVKTQGDNEVTNPTPDNYTVKFTDIIGTCTEDGKIGGIGGVIAFLRSSLGFFLCIVLPLILLFIYELYRFIMLLISESKRQAQEQAMETEEEIKRRAIEEYLAQIAAAQGGTTEQAPTTESTEPTATEPETTEPTEEATTTEE